MQSEQIIGWDIGGAHLKAARVVSDGQVSRVLQLPCPLWLGLDRLQAALDEAVASLGITTESHAMTMTGELADNFADRTEGVRLITQVMVDRFGAERVKVYAGKAGFLQPDKTIQATEQIASANWLAAASWISTTLDSGLFIDIGSTTTDLIPFAKGEILAKGCTDRERLRYEELIYTGAVRTPLMAVANRIPIQGEWVAPMNENFATIADVYRILKQLPVNVDQHPAADGSTKTIAASERRLARMLGMDAEEAAAATWHAVARYFAERQLRLIADACSRLYSRGELNLDVPIIGAGVGRFLVRSLAQRLDRCYLSCDTVCNNISAKNEFSVADCAPAVAVAVLLQRQTNTISSSVLPLYS